MRALRPRSPRSLAFALSVGALVLATANFGLLAQKGRADAEAPKLIPQEMRAHHILSRLGFGARPGEAVRVRALGVEAWLEEQLSAKPAGPETPLGKRLAQFETLGIAPPAVFAHSAEIEDRQVRSRYRGRVMEQTRESVIVRALRSDRQLYEVLVAFWRDHFNVDVNKDSVRWTVSHWEQQVLRPHALGRFDEFLMATAKHPAMLVYLDNHLSRRPPGKADLLRIEREARRRTGSRDAADLAVEIASQRGLNENYARELLELHTLGADQGYTQRDVEEVAKALTGWTIDYTQPGDGFLFRHYVHANGARRLMGRALPRGRREKAIRTGEAIIQRLARHKRTSTFLAEKLVARLVNDEPPAAMVEAAAEAYRKHEASIPAMVRAIVLHPEFFAEKHFRAKFKTPIEFLLSALRATEAELDEPVIVLRALQRLGQPLYACEDPTGWSDAAEGWRDPGVMALRWRYAIDLASGGIKGVRIPDRFWYGLPKDPLDRVEVLVEKIVPAGLGSNTRAVLDRIVFQMVSEGAPTKDLDRKVTGILLGSPEFQLQ